MCTSASARPLRVGEGGEDSPEELAPTADAFAFPVLFSIHLSLSISADPLAARAAEG
jgi:hypothetical protein